MKNLKFLFLIACSVSVLSACSNTSEEEKPAEEQKDPTEKFESESEEYESYISSIDENDSLSTGNTLYYSKDNGESYEVEFVLNDSSEIMRMTESFTLPGSGTILSNVFYYRGEGLYATKEYFEKGTGEASYFVERVSYYNTKGEPVVTKVRTAPFEDHLDQGAFKISDKHALSDERPGRALRQEGEFATYFKEVISQDGLKYIIVGEKANDGFYSSLLVNYRTPYTMSLIHNESSMKGTHLRVNFETLREASGYSYQSLIFASEWVEE